MLGVTYSSSGIAVLGSFDGTCIYLASFVGGLRVWCDPFIFLVCSDILTAGGTVGLATQQPKVVSKLPAYGTS